MKLKKIIEELGLKVITGSGGLDVEVTGGYSSDLMSDVIANSQEGNLWVTLQTHQNTVAVAVMKSLACIILVNGREPDIETSKKAEVESIVILGSNLSTFELVGRLYQMGIKGN